jgi:ABC-type glycerol-3-phosphate transport system substrate-binding protein
MVFWKRSAISLPEEETNMAKKLSRRQMLKLVGLGAAGAALAACQPQTVIVKETVEVEKQVEVTKVVKQVVKETVVVEGTPKVVEKEVTRVIEKVATPVPEDITLEVWNIWGGSRVPLMDDMFARFTEVHPGLLVENVLVPGGERLQKIQTAIAGGTPPDVPMINQQEVPMFASLQALLPLDSWMALEGIEYDEYYDYAIKASQWEGKTYTLPNVSAAYSLYFYNVGHFEEVGLDPSAPPETWDELMEAGKKLTVIEGDQIERLGYQFYHGLPGANDFKQALLSNGGKYLSDDARTVEFASPEGVQALQWLLDTMKEIYGGVETYQSWTAVQGGEDITNPFIAETLSSKYGGVWEVFYITQGNPDLNYLLGLLPYPEGGDSHSPAEGSWSYGVPREAEHPDASWELVEWLSHEPTASCWFMQQQGRPSPLKACNEDQVYYDTFPKTWPTILEMVESAVRIPLTPANPEIGSRLAQALEEAAYGTRTAEEALQWAAEEGQTLLDEAWAKM